MRLDSFPLAMIDEHWGADAMRWARSAGYKYVCIHLWRIETRYGLVCVPMAMLSDGSSAWARDKCPEAWWAHDRLFLSPEVITPNGKLIRLTFNQCNVVYCDILAKYHMPILGVIRYLALSFGSRRVWRLYRDQEAKLGKATLIRAHSLPHPHLWNIDSFDLGRVTLNL